ncbi:MAG: formate C-acetyltransferase/glycerol dehydratase family glycyl radical enzyme [Dehalococcoidia bacterium]|nr:formate C-acetyltransferase/glycerol dehydratase family glycyl radical enzyme [Dehalococcoidia bacterium]
MAGEEVAISERKSDRFPRLARLHEELLKSPKSVCIERARYLTEYMKAPHVWFEPPVARRARAVSHVLKNMSVKIYPDELLVGNLTSKRVGAIIYPEFLGLLVWPELGNLADRGGNSLQISQAERQELENEVFPFWPDKVVADYADDFTSPPMPVYLLGQFGFFLLTEAGGISHTAPDFEKLVKVGLNGIMAEARQRIADLDGPLGTDPEELRKRPFYQAVELACQGVIDFARRYQAEALALAETESDRTRKAELLEIARICGKVPAEPAKTFHEALQSLWFLEVALHQENYEQALCLGRLDQYLLAYYRHDLKEGVLSKERAIELLGSLFIKLSEFVPLFSDYLAPFFTGFPANPAITLGGLTPDGEDATNDLTHAVLDTREVLKTRHPNLHARIHEKSPVGYLQRTVEVLKSGGAMPAFVNDEVIIPALVDKGIREEDARDYVIIGCVEISVPRKTFGSTDAALMSLPICLEMALHNGYCPVPQKKIGVETGDPLGFSDMDDVVEAFRRQTSWLVDQMVIGLNALTLAHEQLYPSPLLSALTGGCLDEGKDVTAGGAVYNFTTVQGVGTADVANSLAAIDRLVFVEKQVTMEQLLKAMEANFEGYEDVYWLANRVPRYGNDNELADRYARLVARIFCEEVARHRNTRGGLYLPGFLSMTTHEGFGRFVGALPSGRKAFQTFANGLSPSDGSDMKGPTACLKSIAKVDYSLATGGVSVNMKFSPIDLSGEEGTQILSALIRGYFELGGMHLQVNLVSRETLQDARQNPQKYPDLMVRVSGYSAYFADLTKEVQDEIIARTEHCSA